MLRAFASVAALASLLLLASVASSDDLVCTRYENGRTFILPGCRGPDGSGDGTGRRVHPFTGQPWSSEMAILSWNQLMVLVALGGDPGLPTTAEGPFAVSLMASFSKETATGAKISRIRVTTKDLIQLFKQQFDVNGRKARLVIRREIEDLEALDAQLYFVLDGVDYLVEDFIEPLPLSLPESLLGSASGHRLRSHDGAVTALGFQQVSAMALGDLAVDGFSVGLFSLDSGKFALATVDGRDAGLLCKKFTSRVTGGMQVSGLSLESPMLVTGTLQLGPEKLVAP